MGLPAPGASPPPPTDSARQSSSLPFGRPIPLADVSGPTYLTAQTAVQQAAYALADRIWAYSPDTFDLDLALRQWSAECTANARGAAPSVQTLQIRAGAATIALGYMFSADFDLAKRHVPQAIVATSAALTYLRSALDQLSLLYSVASPLVAHVSALDYAGGDKPELVTDYVSALTVADELDLGLLASFSPHESQHIALLATLFSKIVPTLHVYDGVRVGRETHRIIDVLDQKGLKNRHDAIAETYAAGVKKNTRNEERASQLLKAFNDELGTDYGLFEYHGHEAPESILVTFGTVEASLAAQVAASLAKSGTPVGAVNVRVYRPFVEEAFLQAVPKTVKTIGILGQVHDQHAASDPAVQSILYRDVLAAFAFADDWPEPPKVVDVKYPREQTWTPLNMAAAFQFVSSKPVLDPENQTASALQLLDPEAVQQFTAWSLDDSPSAVASIVFGQALSKDSASNVTVSTKYDNLTQGGAQRTDIRKSKKSLDASYAIEAADVVYVGDESILKQVDISRSLKFGGKTLLRLPGVKDEDLEKKLSPTIQQTLSNLKAQLFILDTSAIEHSEGENLEGFLVQLALARVSMPKAEGAAIRKLASINGSPELFESLSEKLGDALREIEIPQAWSEPPVDQEVPKLPSDIKASSFVPFDKHEDEPPTLLKTWTTVAQGLAFKEAFATQSALRPDLGARTWTIHLCEHRRLTPLTYDRNIMHLEFDLGDSGMEYHIGDSLGIHPRNDDAAVRAFIASYGLDADAVVAVPSRADPAVDRASTVHHALAEHLDIFGRPARQFYEALAEHATDDGERKSLLALGGPEGAVEFKRRAEVDTVTHADVLDEFPNARPPFATLARLLAPLKRREYSIASCQAVAPRRIALMIVTVEWRDPRGRARAGLTTRFLDGLRPGDPVTVSLKPSVMKLPADPRAPVILAGLGTGLAPFRAFAQYRALQRARGVAAGPVLLYMGSRHQREEYCYGEEWEAYRDAGVLGVLSCAFSRDQAWKVYIQDRMRETQKEIEEAYLARGGSFYLCGPTWPVPDVQAVLEEVVAGRAKREGKKVNPSKEIARLKEEGRYVLEVY